MGPYVFSTHPIIYRVLGYIPGGAGFLHLKMSCFFLVGILAVNITVELINCSDDWLIHDS